MRNYNKQIKQKNMEKVFVFHVCQISDGSIIRDDVRIFDTIEKAKKEFNDFVVDEESSISRRQDADEWVISRDTGTEYETFIMGHYNENSTYAWIGEVEVE